MEHGISNMNSNEKLPGQRSRRPQPLHYNGALLALLTSAWCVFADLPHGLQGASYSLSPAQSTIILNEYMRIYNFPEQMITLPVSFASGTAKQANLKVTIGSSTTPIPYVIENARESGGWLLYAEISLRTSLASGESKAITIVNDASYTPSFAPTISFTDNHDGSATVVANKQTLRIPYNVSAPSGSSGPLLAISRDAGVTWVGSGSLENCAVASITTQIVSHNTLFLRYRVTYVIAGGKSYIVEVTVQHNEEYLLIDEYYSGFLSADNAFLAFNMDNGIAPDSISFMATLVNKVRYPTSGKYGRAVGLYSVNSEGDLGSMTFLGAGVNALAVCAYRKSEWETEVPLVYNSNSSDQMIHVYNENGQKSLKARIEGSERHWVMGLIPRASATAGSAVRMYQKVTDLSLNVYANLMVDYDESLDLPVIVTPPLDRWDSAVNAPMTFAEYKPIVLYATSRLVNNYYDEGEIMGFHWGEAFTRQYGLYSFNRAAWTPADRAQARAILLLTAHMSREDTNLPHASMIAGHANFVSCVKQGMALAAATFPHHPYAESWKEEYVSFFDTWAQTFVRDPVPEYNLAGGRFYENISNYSLAALENLVLGFYGVKKYDGTDLFTRPKARSFVNYLMNALMPGGYGYQFPSKTSYTMPTVGAHALPTTPYSHHHTTLIEAAKMIVESDSTLGNGLLWLCSQGTLAPLGPQFKPVMASTLFDRFGAVLRYDLGGPNEAYVYVQQILGSGYRWSSDFNGNTFYASKGTCWSFNPREANVGDAPSVAKTGTFTIGSTGLTNAGRPMKELLYDFGVAQFYTAGGNGEYLNRKVMMLRDDYLVLYDDVSAAQNGTFRWNNLHPGLLVEFYNDITFTNKMYTFIDDDKPFGWRAKPANRWDLNAPYPGMKNDSISIRYSGTFIPDSTGINSFRLMEIPAGRLSIWLDGQLVLQSADTQTVTFAATAGRRYAFRADYVHLSGDADIRMLYNGDTYFAEDLNLVEPGLPQISELRAGPGDEVHIVAAASSPVTAINKPYGALVNGSEYVFVSDQSGTYTDGSASFTGTSGYARSGEVAVFEGTSVRFADLGIECTGGFGASATYVNSSTVRGRFTGTTGGTLKVTVPAAFSFSGKEVQIVSSSGPVAKPAFTISGNTCTFAVAIAQQDGYKKYAIVPVGTPPDAAPLDPVPETDVNAKPDLVVTQIKLTPANPAPGDTVHFSAIIKNQGLKASPSVTHRANWRIDGTQVAWSTGPVISLAPGATVETFGTMPGGGVWIATAGTRTVQASADNTGLIDESDETNNSLNRTIVVGGQPGTTTLTVTVSPTGGGSVTKTPAQPTYTQGTAVTLSAVPAAGYYFAGWSNTPVTGLKNPVQTVTMQESYLIMARFVKGGAVHVSVINGARPHIHAYAGSGWIGRRVLEALSGIVPNLPPGRMWFSLIDTGMRPLLDTITVVSGDTVDLAFHPRPTIPFAFGPLDTCKASGLPITTGAPNSAIFEDFDSDGDPDLLIGGNIGAFQFYRNTGGTYAADVTPRNDADAPLVENGGILCLRALCWNDDARPDLVIANNEGTLILLENLSYDREMVFGKRKTLYQAGSTLSGFDIIDINGDGAPDLVLGYVDGTLRIALSTASFSWSAPSWNPAIAVKDFSGATIDIGGEAMPGALDVNGDGNTDVLVGAASGAVRALRRTVSEAFSDDGAANARGKAMSLAGSCALSCAAETSTRLPVLVLSDGMGKIYTSSTALLGDFDGNDSVKIGDLAIFGDTWGKKEGDAGWRWDVNLDMTPGADGKQVVDMRDLAILGDCWGKAR